MAKTLKECAKICSILALGVVDRILPLLGLQFVPRFLSFRASVLDAIFLRPLLFVSARFGFSDFVEIDRFDQA